MNLIPLNSTSIPTHLEYDSVLIVNFDHVYCIDKDLYYPNAGMGVECSLLRINRDSERETVIQVKETRVEILRLLEGPGKFSVP